MTVVTTKRRKKNLSALAGLSLLAIAILGLRLNARAAYPQKTPEECGEIVRETIQNELDAEAHDDSLWCFHKVKELDGNQRIFVACQSKSGEIDRMVASNGEELGQEQQLAEDQRIQKLLNSPRELKKRARQRQDDAEKAEKLLKLIPDAFLFGFDSENGDQIKLNFTPNPKFHPSGHEEQVFHNMQGTLQLDLKQKRLVEINGRLVTDVKFGGGLLGHLDKGGTFLVRQNEVGPGVWELTTMNVQMTGKALFFKTIGVREKEVDTDFRELPESTTLEEAAAMTEESMKAKKQDK